MPAGAERNLRTSRSMPIKLRGSTQKDRIGNPAAWDLQDGLAFAAGRATEHSSSRLSCCDRRGQRNHDVEMRIHIERLDVGLWECWPLRPASRHEVSVSPPPHRRRVGVATRVSGSIVLKVVMF